MFARLAPEQYDSIPGVPEPRENPLLVGHKEAADLLATAYRQGRLHHALLLSGPHGIGKATFAFHLAYHLLRYPVGSEAPEAFARPETDAPLFRQIAGGSHPSVLHLARPYNEKTKTFRSALTVDEIRRVGRFLSMTAHDGSYRIVIVDSADDMNTNAANALLKNLEEPPQRTLFILIAHSPGALLPTIRSRCQLVRMRPLEKEALLKVLSTLETDMPAEPKMLDALAEKAAGSARAAILMTQFGGYEIMEALEKAVGAVKPDITGSYRLADAVSGRDQAIQFTLFNNGVLELVEARAAGAAERGEVFFAGRLGTLWQDLKQQMAETDAFNLDRRQHVVSVIGRVREIVHSGSMG
ncbi:MAG: DNA polymerase III subunit delta' [Rhizobiaceae bacterium]|nr:MAG: DNA polymerase III subunit delta' [Rhizobiaceae bacterium]